MIKPGEAWGDATDAAPDAVVEGGDRALANFVARAGIGDPVPLVRFLAHGSSLARAVGLGPRGHDDPGAPGGVALPLDAIDSDAGVAVNAIVVGVPPARLRITDRRVPLVVTVDGRELYRGRATTVVIANGQFLDGADAVPRGHPGDGRLEVQIYALTPRERAEMRRRLPAGGHVPHPRIVTGSAKEVVVELAGRPAPLLRDGEPDAPVRALRARVRHPAVRLLV